MVLTLDSTTVTRRAEQVEAAEAAIEAADPATAGQLASLYREVAELGALDLVARRKRAEADAAQRTYAERHNSRRRTLDRLAVALTDAGTPVLAPAFLDSLSDDALTTATAELAKLAAAAGK